MLLELLQDRNFGSDDNLVYGLEIPRVLEFPGTFIFRTRVYGK